MHDVLALTGLKTPIMYVFISTHHSFSHHHSSLWGWMKHLVVEREAAVHWDPSLAQLHDPQPAPQQNLLPVVRVQEHDAVHLRQSGVEQIPGDLLVGHPRHEGPRVKGQAILCREGKWVLKTKQKCISTERIVLKFLFFCTPQIYKNMNTKQCKPPKKPNGWHHHLRVSKINNAERMKTML